jgi:molybdenum cofactor biosynthesis enzyme MoaA
VLRAPVLLVWAEAMNDFDPAEFTTPASAEPDQTLSGSCREEHGRGRWQYNNITPANITAEESGTVIPGRRDLRISLTSACNLRCGYCHNEGQEAPWRRQTATPVSLVDIERLLDIAAAHGARSVKFSGGDPGVYPGFVTLMEAIAGWRARFSGIEKWGIATNGGPFLDPRKFRALAASALDNISIGIDSVEPHERSKPDSPVGVPARKLIDGFVRPLLEEWRGRSIKFDTVFAGDKSKTRNVIGAARNLGINVSVVEINGVMGARHDVRSRFVELIDETAAAYRLSPRLYEPLNEVYLYDAEGNTPIKFYQDHCLDFDCGNCRKIHLRVSPTAQGWGAVPCFLRAQSRTIPLVADGELSAARFEDAIRYNGGGQQWFKNTDYDPASPIPSSVSHPR